ncbi:PepSY domain-containing protein [Corynebacterium lubricantis]|uniref:PepSY domain-containing protein n=1 Tax=Corynebacterium lubricantis TaxID=541095 RepID=UPI00036B1EA6|nr:PepSY domain-containing protein [Corynebacterium lubricantis]
MQKKSLIALALSATTALALAACSENTGDTAATDPTSEATTVTTTAAETETETAEPAPESGDDPVFNAIDAVLAEHADGVLVDVDREDSTQLFDIDVVVGNEVIELEVDASTGDIREDEREGDDDDIQKAQAATVTAADAIREALASHPDGVLDEAELDEDDGQLHWEIELDDAQRNDLAELTIPAN